MLNPLGIEASLEQPDQQPYKKPIPTVVIFVGMLNPLGIEVSLEQ